MTSNTATLWRGIASIGALACLVIGVPVGLIVSAGPPLPRGLPSWTQLTNALTQTGIPDTAILEALAVVCWLLWLDLALAVVAEVVATVRGRPVGLPLFARPLQPLAAYMIAAVVLAASAMTSRPAATAVPALRTALGTYGHEPHPAAVLRAHPQVVETASQPAVQAASGEVPPAESNVDGEYVVASGDTLWDIAARKLGNPLRWPQIFSLNRDRVEPDGRRFTDAHWIWPRWILQLPARVSAATPPGSIASGGQNGNHPASPPAAPAGSPSTVPDAPAAPAPKPSTSPNGGPASSPPACASPSPSTTGGQTPSPAPSMPEVPRPHVPSAPTTGEPRPAQPVTLPTGDVVGAALAVGIVAAIAAARLRSRRAAQGQGSRARYLNLMTPVVRRLVAARWRPARPVEDDGAAAVASAALPDRPELPGVMVIGEAGGRELAIDVGQLSGTGFQGEGAVGVLRHLVVGFLQHGASDRAEIWLIDQTATLAPSASEVAAVKAVQDLGAAVGRLDVELVQRTRTLEEHGVPDFAALVRANPAEPLPALLVVAPELSDEALRERVTALVAVLRRLGVGIVFCGSSPLGATLTVEANGVVASGASGLIDGSGAVRLYTLSLRAAAELLAVIAASRGTPLPDMVTAEAPLPTVTPPPVPGRVGPPVHVSLFRSLPVVRVRGEELDAVLDRVTPPGGTQAERERLRDRGRELLAFLALHPEGATKEQTLAELLPDDESSKALDKLRRDINNIRNVLRRATQLPERKFVEFVGERYRLDTEVIDTDVWTVERALNERRALGAVDEVALLWRVLSTYGGQLLEHAPYEWVTPALRESYVRRVVDAGERLTRLLEAAGDIDGAIDAAERTLASDPDDEELYQRLMQLHIIAGRHDAAKRVLRELKAHLAEIDPELEPAEETVRLLQQ